MNRKAYTFGAPAEIIQRAQAGETDAEIRAACGHSLCTIRRVRTEVGVYRQKGLTPEEVQGKLVQDFQEHHPGLLEKLGQVSDSKLAAEYQIKLWVVARARRILHIPGWNRWSHR